MTLVGLNLVVTNARDPNAGLVEWFDFEGAINVSGEIRVVVQDQYFTASFGEIEAHELGEFVIHWQ